MCLGIECADDQQQLLNILQSYFRNAATYHPKPEDAGKTTYFSEVGLGFILRSAQSLFKLQPTSPLFSQHENILQSLTTSIQDLNNDLAAHPPPDYLFFASLAYVNRLLFWDPEAKIIKTDIRQNLILAILQYHAHVTRLRTVIREDFYNTCSNFEDDWRAFVLHAEKLGVVLPLQLPTDLPTPESVEIQEESRQRAGHAIVQVGADLLGERSVQGTTCTPSSLKTSDDAATA